MAYKDWKEFLSDQGYKQGTGQHGGWIPEDTSTWSETDYKRGGPSSTDTPFDPFNITATNFKIQENSALWEEAWNAEYSNISEKLASAESSLVSARENKDKDLEREASIERDGWKQVLNSLNKQKNSYLRNITQYAQKSPGGIVPAKVEAPTLSETTADILQAWTKYGPQAMQMEAEAQGTLTAASGQAMRDEFLRQLAAAEQPAGIAKIREKLANEANILAKIESTTDAKSKERLQAMLPTDEERQQVSQYDTSISGLTPVQRQAAIEGLYARSGKQQEQAMLAQMLPETQQILQQYFPGQQRIVENLGQLGVQSAQEGRRGLVLEDYLAPFRQMQPVLDEQGQPVLDEQNQPMMRPGGLKQLDITSGMRAVSPYMEDRTLGGLQEYQVGDKFRQFQSYQPDLSGLEPYAPGSYLGGVPKPVLDSTLLNINQDLVNQYISSIPGLGAGTQEMARLANERLTAGADLSEEELAAASQAAREAYAARGMALGPQAITSEVLGRAELARQREMENIGMGAGLLQQVAGLYSPAMQQTLQRQSGAEQYGLGAQAQMFSQALGQEELSRIAQEQEFAQRLRGEGLMLGANQQAFNILGAQEQAFANEQAQAFSQRMAKENLAATGQAQRFSQAGSLGTALGQEFGVNLGAASQAQNMAAQAAQTKQSFGANAAQIATGVLGTQAQALSPFLSAYYNVPPSGGAIESAKTGATNAFSLGGLNVVNPLDPTAVSIEQYPAQQNVEERLGAMQTNQAQNLADAYRAAAAAGASKSKKFSVGKALAGGLLSGFF